MQVLRTFLQKTDKFSESLKQLGENGDVVHLSIGGFLVDEYIDMLEEAVKDLHGLIRYFVFQLDFGALVTFPSDPEKDPIEIFTDFFLENRFTKKQE